MDQVRRGLTVCIEVLATSPGCYTRADLDKHTQTRSTKRDGTQIVPGDPLRQFPLNLSLTIDAHIAVHTQVNVMRVLISSEHNTCSSALGGLEPCQESKAGKLCITVAKSSSLD